jgi:SAM-dependent methyltransferase
MTDAESRDRRRTVFGEVADAYEAGRPAYPERLVDDVLAFAALDGAPALEVGAGTGKATVAFAERGVAVTCLEPDERMAALLARKVEAHRRVSVVISSLEQYDGLDQRFGLLYAAQSWHWVDPEKSWDLACQALRPGGALALFWNNILVPEGELNAALLGVYERHDSPALAEGTLQRPPAPALESTASKNLSADERFTDVSFPTYPWSHTFTTDSYLHYLDSISAYRILPADRRAAVFADLRQVLDEHGGSFEPESVTVVVLGRKAR